MRGWLSEEQGQFAEAVQRFVARDYALGPAAPRPVFDGARYGRLAELGCLALAIPEGQGGMGGPVEIMLASERLAPSLAHEPFHASGVHAAALIAAAASARQAARWLPPIASGELITTVAHRESEHRYSLASVSTSARRSPTGSWFISGRKFLVDAAPLADAFVVSARAEDGTVALFAIDKSTPGLKVQPRARLDGLPAGDVELARCEVPAEARLDGASAPDALATAADIAEAAEIAAMVGLMDACIRATLDHVRTRKQFGVPIGSFQALQHRIADMWIACEEARSLAFAAALACSASTEERRRTISMAKVRACDAARLVGAETIQMHGGIGMTDDLAVSHWYKRLLALSVRFGDRRHHLARLAATPLR